MLRVFAIIFVFGLNAIAEPMTAEGVVDGIANDRVRFRKPAEDIVLNMALLDEATKKKVEGLAGQNKRVTLTFDSSALVGTTPLALGVRPDCREMPVAYEELLEIAKKPEVKTTVDFLKAMPEGSMQTFTFVHNSNSVQKEGVDRNWPRVLRMSADGKIIFSYTCEPNSPTFNSLEMIRFDDSVKGYRFTSIDFRGKAEKDIGHRVLENPISCNGCHAPTKYKNSDPRPIWQMYSFWNGVYGGADDKLRSKNLGGDLEDFKAFRTLQKDNPCYANLPWPDEKVDASYADYPYSQLRKTSNYHLRPNLKFTEIQSHLMGQRLARKFLTIPRFKKLRFLVLMDALKCNVPEIDQKIKSVFPKYNAPNYVETIPNEHLEIFKAEYAAQDMTNVTLQQLGDYLLPFHPGSQKSRGARLYALGKAFNFKDADWTMTNYDFMKPETALYNTGLSRDRYARDGDVPIVQLVQGEIFRSITEDYPELKADLVLTRGESEVFGTNFACVDDLGGAINLTNPTRVETVCKVLQEKMDFENTLPRPKYPSLGETIRKNARETVKRELTPELVERGRQLASETCFKCHSAGGRLPKSYHFFNDEAGAREHFKKDSTFLDIVFGRVDATVGEMPPDTDLPEEDRKALKSYFQTLNL